MARGGELQAQSISKRFGGTKVLSEVSLTLRPGQVTLLLGANGAGKSTLIRILAGVSRADRGSVSFGGNPRPEPGAVALYGARSYLYEELTVEENLRLYAELSGGSELQVPPSSLWGLSQLLSSRVGDLSKGELARTALARLFSAQSAFLLLDEPTSFLDDRGVDLLHRAVNERRAGSVAPVMLIATHDVTRLRPVADRVLVLCNGELIGDSAASGDIEGAICQYQGGQR